MTEYTISYARFLLRSWGFTRKVPMGRHVKRASGQKIAWFRKRLGPLTEERVRAGYTVCVQDEAICVADARLRKGVYTPKGVRGVYTYTGSRSKTVAFGLITLDGEGFFQRYGSFTGKEFAEFLKAACERFGKDPDDHRRCAAAQVEIRQGGDRALGRRGAAVSAARLSRTSTRLRRRGAR